MERFFYLTIISIHDIITPVKTLSFTAKENIMIDWIKRLKKDYETPVLSGIAISPFVAAAIVPLSIVGPVFTGVMIAAIVAGNAFEFLL